MSPPQADGTAGGWLRALVRSNRAPIVWDRVVLTSIGITAPVGIALLIAPHEPAVVGAGSLASMGALVASATDVGAVGIERVHRMTLTSVSAALGFALGTLVYGHSVATFIAVVGAALVSGLSGAISATASRAGLFFLMYAVTAANAEFGLGSPWVAPLIFFAGAMWRLLLTVAVAGAVGRTLSPERRAVAAVYLAIAGQLGATGASERRAAATAVTAALDEAYDVMVAAETAIAARDVRWQSLVTMLNASAPVVDAMIASTQHGTPADEATIGCLRALARWVENPTGPVPEPPDPPASLELAASTADRALLGSSVDRAVRVAAQLAAASGRRYGRVGDIPLPTKPSVVERLRRAERSLTTGSETWFAIFRLVLCMALAQAVCLVLHLDRPYLVMLTVAQVMKPDFGSVFARAVQRGSGTVVGVVIGSLVVVVVPSGGWQVLVIAVLAGAIPIMMPRNYGLYSIVTTPLAVILVEVHAGASAQIVGARLLDTLVGCVIVLVFGYLLWPSTWHAPRHLAAGVADAVQSIERYLGIALGRRPAEMAAAGTVSDAPATGGPDDDRARLAARRATYRELSDLRTRVAKSLAEPPAISSAAASWMPEITALEAVTDAVTAAATTTAATGEAVDRSDVEGSRRVLADLAAAIVEARPPGAVSVPTTGPLTGLGDALSTARAVLPPHGRTSGTHHRHGTAAPDGAA
ncbi:FUSC family protein [Agromyces sp. CCNWLW203]|uniref:FUSC family protein n=1 Tax=Agromyces sp. CCNWLW203 TaxID=3112842 RepID=UPI002F964CDC